MAQPGQAMDAPAKVTLTYNAGNNTWSSSGNVSIPKSGLVQFDLDPEGCPPCNTACTPTTASPRGSSGVTGGGFTIGVGSG